MVPQVKSAKLLCAAGRVANVKDLDIAAAGLTLNSARNIPVNEFLQTEIANIYAAGTSLDPEPGVCLYGAAGVAPVVMRLG